MDRRFDDMSCRAHRGVLLEVRSPRADGDQAKAHTQPRGAVLRDAED